MPLAPSVHIETHFGQVISGQAMGCFPNILNISLAAGNIKLLKLARTLCLMLGWPSKDFKREILNVCFFQVSMCCLLSLSVVAALMASYFRLIARKSKPRTLVVRHHRSLCR